MLYAVYSIRPWGADNGLCLTAPICTPTSFTIHCPLYNVPHHILSKPWNYCFRLITLIFSISSERTYLFTCTPLRLPNLLTSCLNLLSITPGHAACPTLTGAATLVGARHGTGGRPVLCCCRPFDAGCAAAGRCRPSHAGALGAGGEREICQDLSPSVGGVLVMMDHEVC